MAKIISLIAIQVTSVSANHVCNNLALQMGTCDYTINEVISQNNYSYIIIVSVSHVRCNSSLDYNNYSLGRYMKTNHKAFFGFIIHCIVVSFYNLHSQLF